METPTPPPSASSRYELVRRIGRGPMAEVWHARAPGLSGSKQDVLLKTIYATPEHEDFVSRLIHGAERVSSVEHPNVMKVLDTGELGGAFFIAMQFIRGKTLGQVRRELARRNLVPPVWFTLAAGCALCDGLEAAHQQKDPAGTSLGLAHHWLDPEFVGVSFTGVPVVLDFGVASPVVERGSEPWLPEITRTYRAPEQVDFSKGPTTNALSDLYSLGVILYEMLTGSHPRTGVDEANLLAALKEELIPPSRIAPWVPNALDSVLAKAMAPSPRDRYASLAQFRAALHAQLAALHVHPTQRNLAAYLFRVFGARPLTDLESTDYLLVGQVPGSDIIVSRQQESETGPAKGQDPTPPADIADVLSSRELALFGRLDPDARRNGNGGTRQGETLLSGPPSSHEAMVTDRSSALLEAAVPLSHLEEPKPQSRKGLVAILGGLVVLAGAAVAVAFAWKDSPPAAPIPDQPNTMVPSEPSAPETAAQSAAEPSADRVELIVIASPPQATIKLDGSPLNGNPFRARVPRDEVMHKVTATAPGYRTGEESVTFDKDVTVRLTLKSGRISWGKRPPKPGKADEIPAPPKPTRGAPKAGDDLRGHKPKPSKTIDLKDPYAP